MKTQLQEERGSEEVAAVPYGHLILNEDEEVPQGQAEEEHQQRLTHQHVEPHEDQGEIPAYVSAILLLICSPKKNLMVSKGFLRHQMYNKAKVNEFPRKGSDNTVAPSRMLIQR